MGPFPSELSREQGVFYRCSPRYRCEYCFIPLTSFTVIDSLRHLPLPDEEARSLWRGPNGEIINRYMICEDCYAGDD